MTIQYDFPRSGIHDEIEAAIKPCRKVPPKSKPKDVSISVCLNISIAVCLSVCLCFCLSAPSLFSPSAECSTLPCRKQDPPLPPCRRILPSDWSILFSLFAEYCLLIGSFLFPFRRVLHPALPEKGSSSSSSLAGKRRGGILQDFRRMY